MKYTAKSYAVSSSGTTTVRTTVVAQGKVMGVTATKILVWGEPES